MKFKDNALSFPTPYLVIFKKTNKWFNY